MLLKIGKKTYEYSGSNIKFLRYGSKVEEPVL